MHFSSNHLRSKYDTEIPMQVVCGMEKCIRSINSKNTKSKCNYCQQRCNLQWNYCLQNVHDFWKIYSNLSKKINWSGCSSNSQQKTKWIKFYWSCINFTFWSDQRTISLISKALITIRICKKSFSCFQWKTPFQINSW